MKTMIEAVGPLLLSSRQATLDDYLEMALGRISPKATILDLGCGAGDSVEVFASRLPEADWYGLDIEHSPEVDSRARRHERLLTYDGVHIPFEAGAFDLVYSKQVLEHVRHPEALLREVCRVLASDGVFVGSTSQLEPYHSRSLWNFTAYGFQVLLRDAGLDLKAIGPSIDAPTLILRRAARGRKWFERYWRTESPVNRLIGLVGKVSSMSDGRIAAAKLLFAGQFCFLATKPAARACENQERGSGEPEIARQE